MQVHIGLRAAFGKGGPANSLVIFGLVALLLVFEDELGLFLQLCPKFLIFGV